MPDAYNELARRLMAAVISHIAGYEGVDRALKQYVPPVLDASWCAEAYRLHAKVLQDANQRRGVPQPVFPKPSRKPASKRLKAREQDLPF